MASIKLKGDTSGEITIQSPAVAGTTALELPATSSTLATQNALGVRNLIINGDMRIDQRNSGVSVTIPATAITYTLDRWFGYASQASKFTVQQNAGSVTPPSGFTNYIGATSSSSYSVGASDLFITSQRIEGLNTAHLSWGTADAKAVTLSFWVRSSLTGTFGGSVKNSAGNRSYPFSYTISSANTWEQKTITISGDTTGTWLTSNGIGIDLNFGLGAGSSYGGTAGSWQSANLVSATGATSVVGTSGATWYVTGIQLEVGTEATPFEHVPYDMELARCQRYYQPVNAISGNASSTSGLSTNISFVVPMRATPTISVTSVLKIYDGVTTYTQSSANAGSYLGGEYGGLWYSIANFSGLTQYRPYGLNTNLNNNIIRASAEL
jgi:hypothetical protein